MASGNAASMNSTTTSLRSSQSSKRMDDAGAMTLLARAGLIGDVHAEDELLELALDYFEKQNVEHVLCTGDVADGAGSVVRCCTLLRQYSVQTVRGNHDRWLL